MKFGLLLTSHMIAEWQEYYVSYDDLKEFITQAVRVLNRYLESRKLPELVDDEDEDDEHTNHFCTTYCHWFNQLVLYCRNCHVKKGDEEVISYYQSQFAKKLKKNKKFKKTLHKPGGLQCITPKVSDKFNLKPFKSTHDITILEHPPRLSHNGGKKEEKYKTEGLEQPNHSPQHGEGSTRHQEHTPLLDEIKSNESTHPTQNYSSLGINNVESSNTKPRLSIHNGQVESNSAEVVRNLSEPNVLLSGKDEGTAVGPDTPHDAPFTVFGPFDSVTSIGREIDELESPRKVDNESDESLSYLSEKGRKKSFERRKSKSKIKSKIKKKEKSKSSKNSVRERDRRFYNKIIEAWKKEIIFQCEKVNGFYELIEAQLIKDFRQLKIKLEMAERKKEPRKHKKHDQAVQKQWKKDRAEIIQHSLDRLLKEEQDLMYISRFQLDSEKPQLLEQDEDLHNQEMEATPELGTEYVTLQRHNSRELSSIHSGDEDNSDQSYLSRTQEKKLDYNAMDKTYQLQSNTHEWIDLQIHKQHTQVSDELSQKTSMKKSQELAMQPLQPLLTGEDTGAAKAQSAINIHMYQLKINAFTLYRRLVALSNFASLNRTGFGKACKKFDKNLKCKGLGKVIMSKMVESKPFVTSDQCNVIMHELTQLYSKVWEHGDFNKGKVALLSSISYGRWSRQSFFLTGLKIGFVVGLLSWLSSIGKDAHLPQNCIYLYRCVAGFILWIWLWGFDIFVWTRYRLNYVFIFELDPRTCITYYQIFDEATNLTILYLLNLLAFIQCTRYKLNETVSVVFPSSLLILMIAKLILPWFTYKETRLCLLTSLYQTIIAPFGRVRFRDFYLGDVLTSMVKLLDDFYMAWCTVLTDDYYPPSNSITMSTCQRTSRIALPIIICMPYWFRFMQCLNRYFITGDRFPHLANSIKYALAMNVTLLSALHGQWGHYNMKGWPVMRIVWFSSMLGSTGYAYYWDIFMDWNLFTKNEKSSVFGRALEFPTYWYYIAMVLDLLLRFAWIFTLIPIYANPYFQEGNVNTMYFVAGIEAAELCRRAMWSIFRVENAHISRKQEFTQQTYIPLLYEQLTLHESKHQRGHPQTMVMEICSMVIIVLGFLSVIWAVYGLEYF